MCLTTLPFLSVYDSVNPNAAYLFQFNSCIRFTSCQSSRRRLVTVPVVVTTNGTIPSNISRAFFAMYCESRKSRSRKSAGMSASFMSNLFRFVRDIALCAYSSSTLLSYSATPCSSYFPETKSMAVILPFSILTSRTSSVLFENESSKRRDFGMICSMSKRLLNSSSRGM